MNPAPFAGPLAGHYLACIETEDRRSLQLRVEDAGKRFVAPWTGEEGLLHSGGDACDLTPSRDVDRVFLSKGVADAAGPDAGFYGYPLFFDGEGRLSPLFVLPVTVEEASSTGRAPAYRVHRAGDLALNRYLFTGATDEELDAIQSELESDDFGTFGARLKAAFDYLGAHGCDVADTTTEPFPKGAGARWVRTPVFLRDARGPFTFNLRQDLSALAKYASVQADAPKTALATLWGGGTEGAPDTQLAEVLALNASQHHAVRAAARQPLTVITGPPGTGKSQVVVDLLATAVLENRPVLFASKNNRAVDVVRERLREALGEPLDFTLRAGSREAMDALSPEILDRLARLRKNGPPGGEDEATADVARARAELAELHRRVALRDEAAAAEQTAAASVPDAWRSWTGPDDSPALDLSEIRFVLDEALAYGGEAPLGIARWVRRLFRGSAIRRDLVQRYLASLGDCPSAIRDAATSEVMQGDGYPPLIRGLRTALAYYAWLATRAALRAAEVAVRDRLRRTDSVDAEVRALNADLAEAMTRLVRAVWGRRLYDAGDQPRQAIGNYFDAKKAVGGTGAAFAQSLDRFAAAQQALAGLFPVWITPSLSIRNAAPLRPGLFDLVVIDEASQCDIASAVPLLYRARRAAVIGDPHQLRHIPAIDKATEEVLPSAPAFVPEWSYVTHSLFDIAARANKQAGHGEPLFLAEHYRSYPSIIEFSNVQFYGGRLRVRTDLEALAARLPDVEPGVFWTDVPGRVPASSRSAYNDIEVAAVVERVGVLLETAGRDTSIGVVTPFRAQTARLNSAVRLAPWYEDHMHRVGVGTAYTFQGDERDVIVFSPVVADGMRDGTRRWAAMNEPLLNVSVTRARATLHIVGDRACCEAAGGPLGALAAWATRSG